ncbi:MAG: glycosyltransferase [Chitinophagales bacterium]|nr:glycosyltransferase [Chitinophagales bacterium]MDW8428482.1 glycosyltransferase [Chitinophagales bacterium]
MLLTLLAIAVIIQLIYYIFFYSRLADYKSLTATSSHLPPLSVIICAHDEVRRLQKNLPAVLEQKYPEFEVIVVNDQSNDDSEIVLMQLQLQYPHLQVRHIRNQTQHLRGKKYPLTIGMRAARYNHVVLTDADCAPASDHWLRDMAAGFAAGKDIVLGYAPYRKAPGLLNRFIRFETCFSAMQFLSFALAGFPYMGVGRNLAYRKQIFFDFNIYSKYPSLLSGDDDLLVNQAAHAGNVAVQINPSSFVYSPAKQTYEEFWHQKNRHVSTARYYKLSHKVLLFMQPLTGLMIYVLFAMSWLNASPYAIEATLMFLLWVLVQSTTFRTVARKLCEEDLARWLPILYMLTLLYYIKLIPGAFFRKPTQWR